MKLKGWFGEKKTAFRLWSLLNSKIYRKYHDVILPSTHGTTQIDHMIISRFGLFIIETKNRKGWIFGSEHQANWTQTNYQLKHQFQNPLHQTYRQKKILSGFLNVNEDKIHTIIYFNGNCTFKTPLPDNVMTSGLVKYIKRFQSELFSSPEIERITSILDHHIAHNDITSKGHIQSLKQRHESTTICPKCGAKLVVRTAKKGRAFGSKFFGCENYPTCRFTKQY